MSPKALLSTAERVGAWANPVRRAPRAETGATKKPSSRLNIYVPKITNRETIQTAKDLREIRQLLLLELAKRELKNINSLPEKDGYTPEQLKDVETFLHGYEQFLSIDNPVQRFHISQIAITERALENNSKTKKDESKVSAKQYLPNFHAVILDPSEKKHISSKKLRPEVDNYKNLIELVNSEHVEKFRARISELAADDKLQAPEIELASKTEKLKLGPGYLILNPEAEAADYERLLQENYEGLDFEEQVALGAHYELVKLKNDPNAKAVPTLVVPPLDLRYLRIPANTDLSGANIMHANFHKVSAPNLDIHDSIAHGIDLSEADVSRMQGQGAQMLDANLTRANLDGADLSGTNLFNARMELARLNSGKTKLPNANLSGARIHGADFVGADLTSANLSGVQGGYIDSEGHLLSQEEAKTVKKNRNGSLSYRNTDGEKTEVFQTNFDGAIVRSANFNKAHLANTSARKVDFASADSSPANLSGSDLLQANFAYQNLSGVSLEGTDLKAANFNSANLSRAILRYADAQDANFADVDFSGADLEGIDLQRARLRHSNLGKAKDFYDIVSTTKLSKAPSEDTFDKDGLLIDQNDRVIEQSEANRNS